MRGSWMRAQILGAAAVKFVTPSQTRYPRLSSLRKQGPITTALGDERDRGPSERNN